MPLHQEPFGDAKSAIPRPDPRWDIPFRRVVPPELREILQKTEISVSLETKDPREAERRIRKEADKADETFEQARKGTLINWDLRDAMDVVKEWLFEEIENWWVGKEPRESPKIFKDDDAASSISAYIGKWNIKLTPRVKAYALQYAQVEFQRYRSRQTMRVYSESELAQWGDDFRARYFEELEEATFGHGVPIYPPEFLKPIEAPAGISPPPVLEIKLSSITMNAALAEFLSNSDMSISSRNEWTLCWRRLVEFTGNINLSELRAEHIREWHRLYRRCPKRLPNNVRKKSLRDIVDFAEKNYVDYETVSRSTAQKYLTCVKSVLNWAVDEGHISSSPALTVKSPKSGKFKTRDTERLPFAVEDLELIFSSPVYAGSHSAKRRYRPGAIIVKDAIYWLPLLALFTGARLEELGQLLLADIRREGEISYIDINDDEDKDVKNEYSIRQVPLHPKLIELGFLKYVEVLRKAGARRVFPELVEDGRDSLTQAFSRNWNRNLRSVGVLDRRKVFHSFRHLFKDAARESGLEKSLRDKLQGHAPEDVAEGYGKGWSLTKLYEGICRIDFNFAALKRLLTR